MDRAKSSPGRSVEMLNGVDFRSLAGLTPRNQAYLLKAGLTTTLEVLCCPLPNLARRLGLPPSETETIVNEIAASRVPKPINVGHLISAQLADSTPSYEDCTELINRSACIATGDTHFDALLGGGIRVGSLTEVVGAASGGKSQFGLKLALYAQLPSTSNIAPGGVIHITSEASFASGRLLELADQLELQGDRSPREFLDNIHLTHLRDMETLEHIVSYSVPELINRHANRPSLGHDNDAREAKRQKKGSLLPIRLLIIDSLAAAARTEWDTSKSGMFERSKSLIDLGEKLRCLAERYRIAVVVINQVTDDFRHQPGAPATLTPEATQSDPAEEFLTSTPTMQGGLQSEMPAELVYARQHKYFGGQSARLRKTAALGLQWTNCISTRLMLSRISSLYENDGVTPAMTDETESKAQAYSARRRATLIFSPFAPHATLEWKLDKAGYRALGPPALCERYTHRDRG
ncbi:hypothetical protein E5Q_00641 [Mixia osmundae IAM 14324]|uniref:RecA family profile 1 domain-containing protein n=1 Tax=Mixia osmundae (strain CBS 9802 / IAM 14324 / JCM 22182 / KY 12970) TaxID=764103 RepID=G7DTT4_MIXOS|nr:hypothetical protein E5Q_00641 [Mixia osmundae IAM 14324]